MLATTPLGLPYPVANVDPPNGPAQIQALAQAVQTLLGTIAAAHMQEGTIDAGSFEVTQASGGAGPTIDVASNIGRGAMVTQDSTGLLFPIKPTVSKTTVTVTAGHATLPRVDAVVVSMAGVVSVIAGTATAGATADNARDGSHGGATIPSDALHLADLVIPATDMAISNDQIRDRRKRANGAHARLTDPAHSTSSATLTEIASTRQRIECSGAPIRAGMSISFGITADKFVTYALLLDGASQGSRITQGRGSTGVTFDPFWTVTPTAGSHVFSVAHASNDGTTSLFDDINEFVVQERIGPMAANNTTTSG